MATIKEMLVTMQINSKVHLKNNNKQPKMLELGWMVYKKQQVVWQMDIRQYRVQWHCLTLKMQSLKRQ